MSSGKCDKLVVSNFAQLQTKYGASGVKKVESAIKKLIAADGKRGIVTEMVDLSDAKTMSGLGAAPIPAAKSGNPKLNKVAIDAVFNRGDAPPAYLLLLGSIDVIPHVPLDNPVHGDGDDVVPSDLPYACSKPYSTDVQDFTAPTRVVGRLPNVTKDTDPTYLLGLLESATDYKDRPASDYDPFLGISARVWQKSTERSLAAIFGAHAGMKISPPDGYKWSVAEASQLVHFINCHGAPADPCFYGQKGASYPVAHSAAWMSKKVIEATVLAAECCYGAELYDPSLPSAGGQMGMCNTYLQRKAYAYFGSSTIAYGPTNYNDQADLICQYFLNHIRDGASAGRACLQARLDYVSGKRGLLKPTDLKTIGQFNLMADPSLTPVTADSKSITIPKGHAKDATANFIRQSRQTRRAALIARAESNTVYRLHEPKSAHHATKTAVFGKLRQMAAKHGVKDPDVVISYVIGEPRGGMHGKGLAAIRNEIAGSAPIAVHTIIQRHDAPSKIPHLQLVKGVQAVEYEYGMRAQSFESR